MELRAAVLVNIALATLSAALPLGMEDMFAPHVFYQKLDHFSPHNQEYFKQRYFKYESPSYYDGAPILLDIGGEDPVEIIPQTLSSDAVMNNYGIFFALEHRYYGLSVPESYDGGIPKYLSSEQALEDIARFIQVNKQQYPNSPWIVTGCSYAGNLATWMRQKYPHLVQGAIAGSAPLLAKADFYEYAEVIGEVIKKKAPLCHQKLVEANEEFKTLAKTPRGRRELERMFGRHPYHPRLGQALHYNLFSTIQKYENTSLQYLKYYQPFTSKVCDSITRNTHGKSTLEILINTVMPRGILDNLELVTSRLNIGFPPRSEQDGYMWVYQTCNEFGYFQTLSSKNQPFGLGPDVSEYASQLCEKYGISWEMVQDNVRKTNLRYGGKTPNVTNVVFLHGSNDPWHPLGVLRDLSSSARAFVFEGLSHCEYYGGRIVLKYADERLPQWRQMLDEVVSIVRSWF